MNLLFIDCEIANKHNVQPKIAQFGYVLVDESLNVIEEDDFFINPGDGEDFSRRGAGDRADSGGEPGRPGLRRLRPLLSAGPLRL